MEVAELSLTANDTEWHEFPPGTPRWNPHFELVAFAEQQGDACALILVDHPEAPTLGRTPGYESILIIYTEANEA